RAAARGVRAVLPGRAAALRRGRGAVRPPCAGGAAVVPADARGSADLRAARWAAACDRARRRTRDAARPGRPARATRATAAAACIALPRRAGTAAHAPLGDRLELRAARPGRAAAVPEDQRLPRELLRRGRRG